MKKILILYAILFIVSFAYSDYSDFTTSVFDSLTTDEATITDSLVVGSAATTGSISLVSTNGKEGSITITTTDRFQLNRFYGINNQIGREYTSGVDGMYKYGFDSDTYGMRLASIGTNIACNWDINVNNGGFAGNNLFNYDLDNYGSWGSSSWISQKFESVNVDGTDMYIRYLNGNMYLAGQLYSAYKSVLTPAFSFNGDTDTGLSWSSSDQCAIVAGGVELLRFKEDGASSYIEPLVDFRLGTLFMTEDGGTAASTFANRSITDTCTTDQTYWLEQDSTQVLGINATGNSGSLTNVGITVNGKINAAADAQADDDYEVSIPGITALHTLLEVTFIANTANTDGATLEITEVGDLDAILKMNDQALVTGDIEAGQVVKVVFDGTNWQMVSQIAQ